MLRHYITENIETHNNIEIKLLWNIVRYFQIQVITLSYISHLYEKFVHETIMIYFTARMQSQLFSII